jgi:hypothetical protein
MTRAHDGELREMGPGSPFVLRLTKDGVRGDEGPKNSLTIYPTDFPRKQISVPLPCGGFMMVGPALIDWRAGRMTDGSGSAEH